MTRPLIDLLVVGLKNAKADRVDVEFEHGGTWITVFDSDLLRRPVVGDVLRIRQPEPVELNPKGQP